jgi:hypothetical protein
MSFLEKVFPLFILAISFVFGLVCVNNPFVVARIIVLWVRFASSSSLEGYKTNNTKIKEAFELIDQPSAYVEKFSNQIQTIRRTGYVAIFVAVIGVCIGLLGG